MPSFCVGDFQSVEPGVVYLNDSFQCSQFIGQWVSTIGCEIDDVGLEFVGAMLFFWMWRLAADSMCVILYVVCLRRLEAMEAVLMIHFLCL